MLTHAPPRPIVSKNNGPIQHNEAVTAAIIAPINDPFVQVVFFIFLPLADLAAPVHPILGIVDLQYDLRNSEPTFVTLLPYA